MLRSAHILQLCAMALMGIGVLMVHSAGMNIHRPELAQPLSVLGSRHLILAILATSVMLLASQLDVRELVRRRGLTNPLLWLVLAGLALCVLTLLPGFGVTVNGARRWLAIGSFRFQPSELMKVLTVVTLAWWCTRRQGGLGHLRDGLLPALAFLALVCGLIVIEDLGTAALIGVVGVLVLVAGGGKIWHFLLLIPVGLAGLVAAIMAAPYRIQRLTIFMNPWVDPEGAGYHPLQSQLAFAMGGLTGRGLGNSVQKFGYLPEDTTDFIFAIISEELGLAGAGLIIGLYLIMLWVSFGIIRNCPDLFGRLLAFGILTTIALQAAINIAVVTVLVPTKGIALPLISAGGTGWIVTAFGIGLVASLDNARHLGDTGEEPVPLRSCATG